jgi:uncharacterized delta-60 repeat protein
MTRVLTLSTVLALAACGDDHKLMPDAGTVDMEIAVDAPPDAPVFVAPTPFAIGISATGQDQAMSAVAGPNGSFYIAGYTSASTAAPTKYLFVAKLTSAGALDTGFATGGVYTSTIVFTPSGSSGTDEIDVAVQSDGHIVVAATVANDADATDRDIGLFRLDATGALDTAGFGTAGTGGFARINLSTKNATGTAALDSQRGLAIGPSDQIFIHATARDTIDTAAGGGERIDTDFAVARLSAAGVLDVAGYGTGGKFLLDFSGANAEANATAKGIHVMSDGTVIAAGYANAPGIGSAQPVLYRLTPTGALDSTNWSSNGGVFYDTVLAKQTEIYNISVDGDRITTAGYGRATDSSTNCCNDWVSLRFDTSSGERDTTFGGATGGAVLVDPTGMHTGSNCRNAITLPGGKTALIGSAGPGGTRDAALAILTQNGALDTTYGTGVMTFALDGTEDQWWGGAVSGGKLLLVGWKGVGATQTDAANDNSYGVLLSL